LSISNRRAGQQTKPAARHMSRLFEVWIVGQEPRSIQRLGASSKTPVFRILFHRKRVIQSVESDVVGFPGSAF